MNRQWAPVLLLAVFVGFGCDDGGDAEPGGGEERDGLPADVGAGGSDRDGLPVDGGDGSAGRDGAPDGGVARDAGADGAADPGPEGGDGAVDGRPAAPDAGQAPADAAAADGAVRDGGAPGDDVGPVDAAVLDGGGVAPGPVCPGVDFRACGGDPSGRWRLVDFCMAEGPASAPRACEGPGEDLPACQQPPNARICRLRYGGTADFQPGQVVADFSVGVEITYTFDDACLAALGEGEPAEVCAGLANRRVRCVYSTHGCRCEAASEPESEVNVVGWAVEGDRITIGGAPGRFCVDGDRLTIVFDRVGPAGWKAWLLAR